MPNFEPFLKQDKNTAAFADSLEEQVQEALTDPIPVGERHIFDAFGLTPLGFAVSEELARVVSISDRPFMDMSPAANPSVPGWLRRGNSVFKGDSPDNFFFRVVDPFNELVLPVGENAINIAQNCMSNGTGSVMDANLVTRSVLSARAIREADRDTQIAALRNSHKLVARLAMLNDMNADQKGRGAFNEAIGIGNPFVGLIPTKHLDYDEETHAVDLSKEARAIAKECGVKGRGCPALRILVDYKGQSMPMIEAFWSGSVDVIQSRLKGES